MRLNVKHLTYSICSEEDYDDVNFEYDLMFKCLRLFNSCSSQTYLSFGVGLKRTRFTFCRI